MVVRWIDLVEGVPAPGACFRAMMANGARCGYGVLAAGDRCAPTRMKKHFVIQIDLILKTGARICQVSRVPPTGGGYCVP